MKIEMGESLMQSYLKYEKECLITQTNWKISSSWGITDDDSSAIRAVFERIAGHGDFSDVFKGCSLDQALKQAELDVVGINNDKLYMVEVAFHENGLQYGDKLETKDRVCKKFLRAYLIGLAYFPNFTYEIIFASPKVNPATDMIIKEYLTILDKDFGDEENVTFRYLANEDFKNEVLIPTLRSSLADSDTSELFIRSAKMLDLFGVLDLSEKTVLHHKPALIHAGGPAGAAIGTDDKLLRDLRTVGFSTFVKFYEYYSDSHCSSGDIKILLFKTGKYKPNSCSVKASTGKNIVIRGQAREALKIIENAGNVAPEIVSRAHELLSKA